MTPKQITKGCCQNVLSIAANDLITKLAQNGFLNDEALCQTLLSVNFVFKPLLDFMAYIPQNDISSSPETTDQVTLSDAESSLSERPIFVNASPKSSDTETSSEMSGINSDQNVSNDLSKNQADTGIERHYATNSPSGTKKRKTYPPKKPGSTRIVKLKFDATEKMLIEQLRDFSVPTETPAEPQEFQTFCLTKESAEPGEIGKCINHILSCAENKSLFQNVCYFQVGFLLHVVFSKHKRRAGSSWLKDVHMSEESARNHRYYFELCMKWPLLLFPGDWTKKKLFQNKGKIEKIFGENQDLNKKFQVVDVLSVNNMLQNIQDQIEILS